MGNCTSVDERPRAQRHFRVDPAPPGDDETTGGMMLTSEVSTVVDGSLAASSPIGAIPSRPGPFAFVPGEREDEHAAESPHAESAPLPRAAVSSPLYQPPPGLEEGSTVILHSLVWRSDLNGTPAVILSSHPEYVRAQAVDGFQFTVRLQNVLTGGVHIPPEVGFEHPPDDSCEQESWVEKLTPRSRALVTAINIVERYGLELSIVEVGSELDACSICLEDMDRGDTCALYNCGHSFHAACVAPWCSRDRSCPNCRHEAPPEIARLP
eukprot:Hpha_TRINITY_DN16601_c0_g1::TRINITY_DN16601_c0_g1_i1::g.180341::m.180341